MRLNFTKRISHATQVKLRLLAQVFGLIIITVFIIIMATQLQNQSSDANSQSLNSNTISPSARIGMVELYVRDLPGLTTFYRDVVMLDVLSQTEDGTTLGKGDHAIVKLVQSGNLPPARRNDAGLYHVAILFDSRAELASVLQNMLQKAGNLYQGSGDHAVSEAFYFADPEGNGIEVYFDRPRSEWRYDQSGSIVMGTAYIDEQKYVTTHIDETKSVVKTGHIHLQVGDITQAREFYVDGLGFEVQASLPNALFISAGGYHHHLGLNTWNSLGAGKRPISLGLKSFEVLVDSSGDIDSVAARLRARGIEFVQNVGLLEVRDPWGNLVIIKVAR